MTPPTIQEARALRDTLEREILEVVQRFEDATGLGVCEVQLHRAVSISGSSHVVAVQAGIEFTRRDSWETAPDATRQGSSIATVTPLKLV